MSEPKQSVLKKVLKPVHLWGLAVGLVISGEYFGWNFGWDKAGTIGFLISTLLVTILYLTFVFSFTELTAAIPHAGGPFAYAEKAFGPIGGFIAGYATLVEFVLAPPAIAFALGSYVHFLYDGIPVIYTALSSYLIFTAINWIGIKESANFNLVITLLAIAELLIFIFLVSPHFKLSNFSNDGVPNGISGIFAALPFAIWFFLGIEGVAMVSEEVIHPEKNIPKGYLWGIGTLVLLALGVMIFSGGIGNWKLLSKIDYPLPEAIAMILGKNHRLTGFFAGIGLLGLIASFHSLITGYSRQIFALSRSNYLPPTFSKIHPRFKTPHWALVGGGAVGIFSLFTSTTDKVIIISALGAIVMYIISMFSLLKLKKNGMITGHFKTPFYPWFPMICLILCIISLSAIVYYNPILSLIFFVGFGVLFLIFLGLGKHKKVNVHKTDNH
jgi:ethanolamine permease